MFNPLLKCNLQFFAADGAEGGGGYDIDLDQVGDYQLDSSETDTNPEYGANNGQSTQSNQSPNLIDLGDLGQVSLDEVKNWKNGNMMQNDYTQKTQALAEQRRQFEQLQQQMENQYAPYKQLDQIFAQNPQLEQQFIQMLQANPAGMNEPMMPFDVARHPMVQQMQEQLSQQQQFFQNFQAQQAQQQAIQEWNTLVDKFPEAKDRQNEIAQFADTHHMNLEHAYMVMNFNNVKTQTQAEMVKNNMKRKPAATMKPQNNANDGAKQIPEGSYENLVDYLLKQNLNLE